MMPCYAGKQSSVFLPSMSAATAATVRPSAAVRGPAPVRRPAAVAARCRMTRGRTPAAAVAATIAAIRAGTVRSSAVRARRDDGLSHIKGRPRVSAVAAALGSVTTALWTRTARRSVRTAVLCTSHGWPSGRLTAG